MSPYSVAHEYRFGPCSTTWRGATRCRTSWKDSQPFPAVLHWKRWKKPNNSSWHATDAAPACRSRLPNPRYAGLAGLKNGDLLFAAEDVGFDIIVTVDQNMPDQYNLSRCRIAFVILCAATNRLVTCSGLCRLRCGHLIRSSLAKS